MHDANGALRCVDTTEWTLSKSPGSGYSDSGQYGTAYHQRHFKITNRRDLCPSGTHRPRSRALILNSESFENKTAHVPVHMAIKQLLTSARLTNLCLLHSNCSVLQIQVRSFRL